MGHLERAFRYTLVPSREPAFADSTRLLAASPDSLAVSVLGESAEIWRDGQDGAEAGRRGTVHTAQNSRGIMGYRDLWMLKAALDENQTLLKKQVA
jgi:hypothetical protein